MLVFTCTLVFQSISIDTNFDKRDRFLSKNTAAGLPKKNAARRKHFRISWDIRIRAFDEAHPTVWGSNHHCHYVGSYCSRIPQKVKMELGSTHHWMRLSLAEGFSSVYSNPSYPSWSRGKLIFSVSAFDSKSSCSKFAYYERRTTACSLCLRVIELFKKSSVHTSYHLYLGLQLRSIEINRDQSRSIFEQKHSS